MKHLCCWNSSPERGLLGGPSAPVGGRFFLWISTPLPSQPWWQACWLDALPPRVDCIWAGPPCTHYSRARTKAKTPRDLDGSDALVQKVLDIIRHCPGAPIWFMENPESGLLKGREVVAGLPFKVVDYCKYGKPYRKRTAIWTNTDWEPRQPLCKHDCPASSGSKHTARAQQAPSSATDVRYSRDELYSIPPALCDEIADYASSL